MMNYNHFTISYIKAIQRHLHITLGSEGIPVCKADAISDDDLVSLKKELDGIWEHSQTAIKVISEKTGATIQSGLFGLVSEFDAALKVGFLMGDRVVLIDYLYERILCRLEAKDINRTLIGAIANSLVSALSLAEDGRIVIIPNPFGWNPLSKKIIAEVLDKSEYSEGLIGLLNMLSITKSCHLHPYTVAESKESYINIVSNQLDSVNVIGIDGGRFAYDGILGALLSERLLQEVEFEFVQGIPLSKYCEVISTSPEFYQEYLSEITFRGSLNSENNIRKIRESVLKSIGNRNKKYTATFSKVLSVGGGVGGATIGVLGITSVVAAPIAVAGVILGGLPVLADLLKPREKEESPIISVFNQLRSA